MKWRLLVKDSQDQEIYQTEVGSEAECDQIIADNSARWGEGAVISKTDITVADNAKQKVLSAKEKRELCLDLIDQIAAYNEDNASPEQMGAIFSNTNMVGIVLALLTGAPKTAKAAMIAHGAELYPQEVVDAYVAKLTAIIGE